MINYIKSISTKHKSKLQGNALQIKINELQHFYMPVDLNTTFHSNKIRAIKKLNYILNNCNRRVLQDVIFEEILMCSLTLVYYFGMRLKMNRLSSKCWYWFGKRYFHQAEAAFHRTMDYLQPERSEITIKTTLDFFSDVNLWPFESFVGQILEVVLFFSRGKTILFNIMLTDIHYVLFSDVKSARHRMRVLYDLLKSENWVIDKERLLPFITRLLDFFAYSITKDNKVSAYGYLRKGFEVCLRRIFERVENRYRVVIITTMLNWFVLVNMSDDDVLEFCSLLDYAAELYKVKGYGESFRDGLIDHILSDLVSSPKALYSLVGCRLLQRFFDRKHNASYLLTPTIYYEFLQVRLKVGVCASEDKVFMLEYRNKLHESILIAFKAHCANSVNVKVLFSVICCILLEVPCDLTAALVAFMAMSIQDYALNGENLTTVSRYWLHAIVVSVMSLICWVHKAPVMYKYVNQIIARRAKEAPQLNPPLLHSYSLGHHFVTWNKPTLYFEDWELRYALWKHFQDKRQSGVVDNEDKFNKKAPTMDLRN